MMCICYLHKQACFKVQYRLSRICVQIALQTYKDLETDVHVQLQYLSFLVLVVDLILQAIRKEHGQQINALTLTSTA